MNLPFLTARWTNLIIINYEVPVEVMRAFLPIGVELDFYQGRTFVVQVPQDMLKLDSELEQAQQTQQAQHQQQELHYGKELHRNQRQGSSLGWVLYDASCGFCAWWVPVWKNALHRIGFEIAPVQSEWVKEKLQSKLLAEELNSDIRLLLINGRLISGADVYIFIMKKIWWLRPLGYFFDLPGLHWLSWKIYRTINRNRFFLSRVCRLPPDLPK